MLPHRISFGERWTMALGRLAPALATLGGRLRQLDLVPGLVTAADAMERMAKALWRLLRGRAPRRGIGLTAALAWRLAAALGGIGLTAALITGLSAQDEDQPQRAQAAMRTTALLQPGPRPPVSGAPIQWTPIHQPIAMFSLVAPELARATPSHAARSGDGAREDLLSFGRLASATPHLALALRTGRLEGMRALPFTVAIAREAAAMALSTTRGSLPVALETRFGSLETADVVLSDGTESRDCIAFRSAAEEGQAFALRGWWCAAGKPSDRRQLTCLIERLDLINAAGDQALRAAFTASELRRNAACEKTYLSSAGRKASWLDSDAAAPVLKVKTIAPASTRSLPTPKGKPDKLRARHGARDPATT